MMRAHSATHEAGETPDHRQSLGPDPIGQVGTGQQTGRGFFQVMQESIADVW